MRLQFFDHPDAFLEAAGPLLGAQPVLGSVIASYTARMARELAQGIDAWSDVDAGFDPWWVVVRDEAGEVVSATMRTAPFPPHPTFSLPMADEAACSLARTLHERGEHLGGANGALPGARVLAEESARLAGGEALVTTGVRLWEATSVTVPPPPEGRLRRAGEADGPLVLEWFRAFDAEADEQAGREPDPGIGEHHTLDGVLRRIRDGVEWLWELPDGTVAHLTGAGLPSYGVSRVGPVFTPREHRGRGIASYVVAELTRRGLAAGHRMCLFTDLDNPTSNKIYEQVGYLPVTDMAEHVVRLPAPETRGR